MDKGELVPTEIVLELLIQAMEKVSKESKGYLIDGYNYFCCIIIN